MAINPTEVFFIRLGENHRWTHECIKETQTVRLSYDQVSHESCMEGKWDIVQDELFIIRKQDKRQATNDVKQIRSFYEASEHVLWMTFYDDKLFWCFSEPEVIRLPDNTKIRRVIGKWSSNDLQKRYLYLDDLKADLVKTGNFRGTICKVAEGPYLVNKINGTWA